MLISRWLGSCKPDTWLWYYPTRVISTSPKNVYSLTPWFDNKAPNICILLNFENIPTSGNGFSFELHIQWTERDSPVFDLQANDAWHTKTCGRRLNEIWNVSGWHMLIVCVVERMPSHDVLRPQPMEHALHSLHTSNCAGFGRASSLQHIGEKRASRMVFGVENVCG